MAQIIVDGKTIEWPDNAPILAACEALGVPFGCHEGQCGTCVVAVMAGMANLHPRNDQEEAMSLNDNERLACQAWVKHGAVRLTY